MATQSKMNNQSPVPKKTKLKVEHFQCKYCRKSCFSQQEVEEHEMTHIVNKKLTCRICGKGFARRSYLHEHMVIHAGLQPFPCDKCAKRFSLVCNLVRHKRIHTGEKPHECEICGQKFTLKKNMVEHVRTHTGEKPFECLHCGAKFARRSSLVRHARTHTNMKIYECHDCGKTFPWKFYLHRHIDTHQKPTKEKVPRKRRTKAQIAQDKEKAMAAEKSAKLITDGPKIKIEEDDNMTPQVFLPAPALDMDFMKEDAEDVVPAQEEVQEKPLRLTNYAPIRPFSVIVGPQSSRPVATPYPKPIENEFVEVKEEPIDLEEPVVTPHLREVHDDIPCPYGETVVKFNKYCKIEDETTNFMRKQCGKI